MYQLLNNREEVIARVPFSTKTYREMCAKRDREFETVYAAWKIGDLNPMRQYLGLPLQHECEDCGADQVLVPHGKSLVCIACCAEREAFLNEHLS